MGMSRGVNGGAYDHGISRSSFCGVILPRGVYCFALDCAGSSLFGHPNPTHVAARSNTTPPNTTALNTSRLILDILKGMLVAFPLP